MSTAAVNTLPYAGDDPATRSAVSDLLRSVEPLLKTLIRDYVPRRMNAQDREDILQTLLVRAWTALKRFDTTRGAKPSTYVYRVCRNELFSILRRKPVRPPLRLCGDISRGADSDADVERIAATVIAAPETVLTKRQAELAHLLWANPNASASELAAGLGVTPCQAGKLRRRMTKRVLEYANERAVA